MKAKPNIKDAKPALLDIINAFTPDSFLLEKIPQTKQHSIKLMIWNTDRKKYIMAFAVRVT